MGGVGERGFSLIAPPETASFGVPGADLAAALTDMLKDPAVAEVDIHFAGPGCYAARAVRSTAF
ncbi:MAG: DUF1203 domain-containing protein [Pseudomonadota bacterium]|nr:DUF1203 domain-containing protein [Pseudomonadota bacterium]